MKLGLNLAILCGTLGLVSAFPAAAMDCAKTATRIEKLVCGRPELKELDDLVEKLYPATLRVAQDPETVASTQRDWRSGVEACNGYECIEDAYGDRLERLTAYFKEVQTGDAVTIATASGDKACVRVVLPQRPTVKPTCKVLDFQPLGRFGGFERFYALYAATFRINGSDFDFIAPVILTADPALPDKLELDLALLDAPPIPDNAAARQAARPQVRGERLEFHLSGDERAYVAIAGGRRLTRQR
ncbi:MAG: hypothetical protein ABIO39_00080 [Caulobacteraceae bacterium]